MTLSGAAVVFLTSLMALPVSYIWDTVAHVKDQRLLFLTAGLSYLLVGAIPCLVLHKKVNRVDTFCMLCLLLFRSVLSLAVAMENDGLIAKFLGHFVREGEPYLKTAHGTMMSYWDGVAHYGMYLMMLAAVSWNQSVCDVVLYWAGSFLYSKLVLILAVLVGKEGLHLPFLFNVPFLIISLVMLLRALGDKCQENIDLQRQINLSARKEEAVSVPVWRRPVHVAFILYYCCASAFTLLRFVAAMGGNTALAQWYCSRLEPYLADPLPYAKIQLMIQTFYFIPYNILSIYSLLKPGQAWVARWSLVYAGAAAQAQFTFMGSSFHYRTPYIHRLPQTLSARLWFWLANGLLFIVPQLAALKSLSSPAFFLQGDNSEPMDKTVGSSQGTSNAVSSATSGGGGTNVKKFE